MFHARFDLDYWVQRFPLSGIKEAKDISRTLTGPLDVSYIEQIRSQVKKTGGKLGKPKPVDLCVWQLGESPVREATKIGGLPYWPATERWPRTSKKQPYTFVAQFCFADSTDILTKLPGDILCVLAAGSDYIDLELRWFKLGSKLMAESKLPEPQWPIQPCHAVLHRTAEYPKASYKLFDEYPSAIRYEVDTFRAGSKIGGYWEVRGELQNPAEETDPKWRKEMQYYWDLAEKQRHTFICQLGSMQAAERQPFINVKKEKDLAKAGAERLLMISDVGGYDFFFDGKETGYSWWSG